MPDGDGSEPVAHDEILYRRIPVSQNWYDASLSRPLSHLAFNPTKFDTTGLSISRAKYKTIAATAIGQAGKSYYVAVLEAGVLFQNEITVVPKPEPGDPGHAEIPSMTYATRKEQRVEELKLLLARITSRVEGPFPKPP